MENHIIQNDINLIGFQVKTFPLGIGEAFDKLYEVLSRDDKRAYYGMSHFENGQIVYFVGAEEKNSGEAKKYAFNKYTIEKGEYLIVSLKDWRNKLDSIKDIFDGMMKDPGVDLSKQCVEWYKSDDEMFCMMSLK